MNTTPYWLETTEPNAFPAVAGAATVDVLVVGGGITGITTGYLLQKAGLSVCLIERDRIGRVDTGHTTAHLTHVTDMRLYQLVENFGRDHAQAVWDAGAAAIDQIEEIVMRENIGCEFTRVPGYLHAPVEPGENADLGHFQEDARLANEFGFDAEDLDQVPHMGRKGVRFADQAKFHPIKYLGALAQSISRDDRCVFEQSDATEFDAEKRRAKVNGHWVSYGLLVLATHNPLMGETGIVNSTVFQTKLALYTSYVLGAQVAKDSIAEASFWDTNDPYVYLRVDSRNDSDYVIFGGEDHKTGQVTETDNCYRHLENSLRKILPEARVDHRWSGQVIETSDGLPYIGETNAGQFIGTGFSGNGMTFGTLAAMMARDWATERKNPWTDLFAPERKKLKGSAWDYLKENKDYPYYMVRGRLESPEGDSIDAVKPGEGKILKVNGKRIAVCRDTKGNLNKRSAVCTHMGCIVRWNSAEATWDCPCHGSRFKPDGSNISGPAETPLGKV
jgi:glycine/D-amino acid oxidase-like deaminating enzyme/nitrite reductase/ring-hydroxylating ferredoxin subunit